MPRRRAGSSMTSGLTPGASAAASSPPRALGPGSIGPPLARAKRRSHQQDVSARSSIRHDERHNEPTSRNDRPAAAARGGAERTGGGVSPARRAVPASPGGALLPDA